MIPPSLMPRDLCSEAFFNLTLFSDKRHGNQQMLTIKDNWNPLQRVLKNILSWGDIEKVWKVAYQLHGVVHTAAVSNRFIDTFQDEIFSTGQ